MTVVRHLHLLRSGMLGTQLVVKWAALALLRIMRVSASNLVPETYRIMIFMVFCCTSNQILGIRGVVEK